MKSVFSQLRQMFAAKSWLLVLPFLLVSSGIAFANATLNALWYDEIYTNFFAGVMSYYPRSILESVILIAQTHTWPPLYYMTFRFWHGLTGDSVFAEAVLSVLYGLITIALIYRFGRGLFGRQGGLFAAALFATSTVFAYYMHEIRGYTLMVLSVTLVTYLYWRLLHERNFLKRRLTWGFSLAVAFCLYTLSASGVFLLAMAAYHFFFEWPSRSQNPLMNPKRWWTIAKQWLNGCIIFAPWLGVLYRTIEHERSIDRSQGFLVLLQEMFYLFSNNLVWLSIPLLILSVFYLQKRGLRYLWLLLGIGFTLLMIVNALTSFMVHPRHAIGLLPFFILLLTAGLLQIERFQSALAYGLLGLWIGFGLTNSFNPAFMESIPTHERGMPYAAYEQIHQVVESCVGTSDLMLFSVDVPERMISQDTTLLHYFGQTDIRFSQVSRLFMDMELGQPLVLNPDPEAHIQEIVADALQVWIFSLPNINLDAELLRLDDTLQSMGYEACGAVTENPNLDTWLYSKTGQCTAVLSTCSAELP